MAGKAKAKTTVKKAPAQAAKPAAKPAKAKPASKPATTAKPTAKPAPVKKLPAVLGKPGKPTKPSLPAPPPPPPPKPAARDELVQPRDIGRLLRYGEVIGPYRIEPRWPGVAVPVASGHVAITDPTMPRPVRAFDRPVPAGAFRLMLSVAHGPKGAKLAAAVLHLGRPPIAKWTVAHWQGQKAPKELDKIPRCEVASGWLVLMDAAAHVALGAQPWTPPALPDPLGAATIDLGGRAALALPVPPGGYAAYWAVDPEDKPICLVIDFDVFSQKDWKSK